MIFVQARDEPFTLDFRIAAIRLTTIETSVQGSCNGHDTREVKNLKSARRHDVAVSHSRRISWLSDKRQLLGWAR